MQYSGGYGAPQGYGGYQQQQAYDQYSGQQQQDYGLQQRWSRSQALWQVCGVYGVAGFTGVQGFKGEHTTPYYQMDYTTLPYTLRNGDEQVLSRWNMAQQALTVSRKQCIVKVLSDGSASVTSLGKGPTLWRQPGGPWNGLWKDDTRLLAGGDQLSLDCNQPEAAVFEVLGPLHDTQSQQDGGYDQQQGYAQQGVYGQQGGGYDEWYQPQHEGYPPQQQQGYPPQQGYPQQGGW